MEELIQKIKELIKLLAQIEKLLIQLISVVGWLLILIELISKYGDTLTGQGLRPLVL